MGPPETSTTGMSSRAAAMTMPGTTLSQLGMSTRPSSPCALAMISTRVGDDLARHQGVVHALVVHGQPVAHADDVELQRDAAALIHPVLDLLGDGVQVHVPGDELVVRVGYADERPLGVVTADAERAEQGAVRGPSRTGVHPMTDTFQDHSQAEVK